MAVTGKALPASGSSTLRTGPIDFHGYSYNNGSGGAGVITFYDNTAASGRVLHQESVATVTAITRVFNPPIRCTIGVTVNLSAGTASGSAFLD